MRRVEELADGVAIIAAERSRQITAEGWSPAHDDEHNNSEMLSAALCYAEVAKKQLSMNYFPEAGDVPRLWPWERNWWKPSRDPVRNLAKAGALIGAEIDRLMRLR